MRLRSENISIKIANLDAKDDAVDLNIADLEHQIIARIDSIESANRLEADALRSQINDLNNQIVTLNSEINNLKVRADGTNAEIISLSDRVTVIENSVIDINDDLADLYDSTGLVVSIYEVDCNTNNLKTIQRTLVVTSFIEDRSCVLVENVSRDDVPIVSVAKAETSWATDCSDFIRLGGRYSDACHGPVYTSEFFSGHTDGEIGSTYLQYESLQAPGDRIRYDPVAETIYTSGHLKYLASDFLPNIYIVTVIGTREYHSPQ